ncbi:hypothetical protein FPOAC1_008106 [Fusarium poae]|uniref:hypothetical protein n=1 Tax=Fusarium poae TaxID=36050 RepID=UPI001CE888A3|nr:hypothetical protein FPOAC1_008106 [Fusarium poae]KAG8668722.1 hypothetical protein FPOAC1_008106 [Fusarium poae]
MRGTKPIRVENAFADLNKGRANSSIHVWSEFYDTDPPTPEAAPDRGFGGILSGPWKEGHENTIVITAFQADAVEAMLYFLYHFDNKQPTDAMVFDARMYEIADNYRLDSLKELAGERFYTKISAEWNKAAYIDAISVVYTSTPSHDRGLRQAVVNASLANFEELIDQEDFESAVKDNPEFAYDIIREQGTTGRHHINGIRGIYSLYWRPLADR